MDNKSLNKKLVQLRPSVHEVLRYDISILAHSMSWGFAASNLLLFLGFVTLKAPISLIIANSVLTTTLWAYIFGVLGVIMVYSLLVKKYKILRYSMLIGVFIKMVWLIALLLRIQLGGSLLIVVLWALVTYTQFSLYIFFYSGTNNHAAT